MEIDEVGYGGRGRSGASRGHVRVPSRLIEFASAALRLRAKSMRWGLTLARDR